ncbi:HK97 gp10 family phage protein [Brevibacillus sp. SYSU BS000544]|uniref:HK97 gp10 family phage protein n=1 Tax=Brevibacillus sp. SYSU BS000544 TaxID=3416443 RepID=UPI003CE50ACD
MSGRSYNIDTFTKRLDQLTNGELKKEMSKWLASIGFQLLKEVQREIMQTGSIDTRKLLHSFEKGNTENVWQISRGGLTLEVGTKVEYAGLVNDGHWQEKRFVPGVWKGERFIYDRNAKTGMMLKAKWIKGTHYWDAAVSIMEHTLENSFERLMQRFLDQL